MMAALYMDVHIPAAVTAGLRIRGIDVLTSQEDGTREQDDASLLRRATELERVLITQDDDLLAIAAEWQQEGHEFAGVIYSHQLGLGIGEFIEELELIASCSDDAELRNLLLFLPLD
jgi:hypothetical protein